MPLNDFRSIYSPYLLKRMKDGEYVVLNREYKPVGFFTQDFIKYEDYPVRVRFKGLTAAKAGKISCKGEKNLEEIVLYDDGSIPTRSAKAMRAYMQRLEILFKLKVK